MTQTPHTILVSVNRGQGFFEDIHQGIADARSEYPDVKILTVNEGTDPSSLNVHLDGYITNISTHTHLNHCHRFTGPVLNLSNHLETPGVPTLCNDDERAGILAAEHFLERGLRSLASIRVNSSRHSRLRAQGFRARLENEPGIEVCLSPEEDHPPFHQVAPSPRLAAWLQKLRTPCGLLCTDDVQAKCVVDFLYGRGIEVPSEFAVLGMNDDRILCELSPVPISSVHLNGRRIGSDALRWMMKALREGISIPEHLPTIPPEGITLRTSTDLYCIQDPLVSSALKLISSHLHEGIDVPFLCEHLHVSRRVLERRFKHALGHGPYQHILRMRLQRAKQLLIDRPDLTIEHITNLCGYRHTTLFYRQFRLQESCSPAQWRERNL